MKKMNHVLQEISERMDLPAELLVNDVQLRISGTRQVLIDRHCGISQFTPQQVVVRTAQGSITIDGQELGVAFMNEEQLIVRGIVAQVAIQEGRDAQGV